MPYLRSHQWMDREGKAGALGDGSNCFVSRRIWPAVDNKRTD